MAQDFVGANNMPYLRSGGQFGCVDPETKVLLWHRPESHDRSSSKPAKNITTNDYLVGDDNTPRRISKVVRGYDDMFDIVQQLGNTYRVNSQHILTLHFLNKSMSIGMKFQKHGI